MSRPTTKTDLITVANGQFYKLWKLVDSMSGEVQNAPYNWKTYPDMNVEFWKKHQGTPLADAKEMLKESHAKVAALTETFSNDELFAKNSFAWTGGSTLGAYCISTTSSHYDWAMKKIKKHIQTVGNKSIY
jgi:hypothetical protein